MFDVDAWLKKSMGVSEVVGLFIDGYDEHAAEEVIDFRRWELSGINHTFETEEDVLAYKSKKLPRRNLMFD